MKKHLFILIFIIPNFIFGQNENIFTPLNQLNEKKSTKIILVSAEWCKICSKTKKLLNDSEQIGTLISDKVQFFEFKIEQEESITINDTIYNYVPSGVNSGRHEFFYYLFEEGKEISYPTIIILGPKNEIIQRFQGYLTEEEWIALLSSLVN